MIASTRSPPGSGRSRFFANRFCPKYIFWGGTFSGNPIQIELMYESLKNLITLNFDLIQKNLNDICTYLLKELDLTQFGYCISMGKGFARIMSINQDDKASRGFLLNRSDSEINLESYCRSNNIYIAKNRLIFSSQYNINNVIKDIN